MRNYFPASCFRYIFVKTFFHITFSYIFFFFFYKSNSDVAVLLLAALPRVRARRTVFLNRTHAHKEAFTNRRTRGRSSAFLRARRVERRENPLNRSGTDETRPSNNISEYARARSRVSNDPLRTETRRELGGPNSGFSRRTTDVVRERFESYAGRGMFSDVDARYILYARKRERFRRRSGFRFGK